METILCPIARIAPGSVRLTAIGMTGDLYRTLAEDAAREWLTDRRANSTFESEARGLRRADKIRGP